MTDDQQADGPRVAQDEDRVAAAMRAHPRSAFLPPEMVPHAALDRPLAIGYEQTSSQPSTVVTMLRLLDVPPGARVLDVGAGSGWTTALLAHLVGAHGSVVGVELVPELAATGARNLGARDLPWAHLVRAEPAVLGWPQGAPYDRILVSAEARDLPAELVDQLADAGRMVIPVRHDLCTVERTVEDAVVTRHGGYRFVPLVRPHGPRHRR